MLNVTILMVGKTRARFVQVGLEFYQRRLKPYLNLRLVSVREEKEESHLSPDLIKVREAERLRAALPPKAWLTALDPHGRELTSEEFAAWLTKREEAARPLAFLLGGHLGLDPQLLLAAHERLALSRLTLTHELTRLVLLEQLYRAATIRVGHPYHV
jgi:23S rRNA (pseudouridine1915-N3)-methyltransferase